MGLLGEDDLYDFTELSLKHGDGWGLAWSTGEGVDLHKSPEAARRSEHFTAWARTQPSDLGMVHLRWATLGLDVREENTHPFSGRRMAFAHNGSVRPPSSLDTMVSDHARALQAGQTDSERYFLAVLSKLPERQLADALTETVNEIASTLDFTSLNCLLLTPEWLFAVCRFNPEALGAEEEPDYFNLRYRQTGDSVVVASTGWGRDWEELANGQMLMIRRRTLEITVRSLDMGRVTA